MLNKIRSRLDSWVMLNNERQGFVSLPNEKAVFMSPPRTAFSLQSPKQYPGNQPLTMSSSAGVLYLTNQRVSSPLLSPSKPLIQNADRIPPHNTNPPTPIILSPTPKSPRLPRLCAVLRPQCLDSGPPTRCGRRHPAQSRRYRAEIHLQRGRSIRLPFAIRTDQRAASAGC
jgi:hypothetical protein